MTGRSAIIGRRMARAAALAALAVAWIASSPSALAQGCAMCRTAIDGIDDPLSRAFSYTTLFMLSMPFAIAATVGGWLVITIRRGGLAAAGAGETMMDGAADDGAARPASDAGQEGMAP